MQQEKQTKPASAFLDHDGFGVDTPTQPTSMIFGWKGEIIHAIKLS
jgi:hypothetical protein